MPKNIFNKIYIFFFEKWFLWKHFMTENILGRNKRSIKKSRSQRVVIQKLRLVRFTKLTLEWNLFGTSLFLWIVILVGITISLWGWIHIPKELFSILSQTFFLKKKLQTNYVNIMAGRPPASHNRSQGWCDYHWNAIWWTPKAIWGWCVYIYIYTLYIKNIQTLLLISSKICICICICICIRR